MAGWLVELMPCALLPMCQRALDSTSMQDVKNKVGFPHDSCVQRCLVWFVSAVANGAPQSLQIAACCGQGLVVLHIAVPAMLWSDVYTTQYNCASVSLWLHTVHLPGICCHALCMYVRRKWGHASSKLGGMWLYWLQGLEPQPYVSGQMLYLRLPVEVVLLLQGVGIQLPAEHSVHAP